MRPLMSGDAITDELSVKHFKNQGTGGPERGPESCTVIICRTGGTLEQAKGQHVGTILVGVHATLNLAHSNNHPYLA